jgi:hypothetical protein
MRQALRLTALLALVGAAALAVATSAGADPENGTIHFSGSFPFSFFDVCTGEGVAGVVDFKASVHVFEDAAGGQHARFQETFHGTAVGLTSGLKYVGPETVHETFNDNGPTGQFEDTFTVNFHFNSEGSTDNVLLHGLIHITVNANGEVTSFIDNERFECTG